MNILSWGDEEFDNEDNVRIDRFKERLYRVFKKGKDNWDQDDLFLLNAVSDVMHLSMKETTEDTFHCVFIIPSEWEEITEVLLRPLFVQADLILKDDRKDRLLFCSQLESICYSLQNPDTGDF